MTPIEQLIIIADNLRLGALGCFDIPLHHRDQMQACANSIDKVRAELTKATGKLTVELKISDLPALEQHVQGLNQELERIKAETTAEKMTYQRKIDDLRIRLDCLRASRFAPVAEEPNSADWRHAITRFLGTPEIPVGSATATRIEGWAIEEMRHRKAVEYLL